MPNFLSFDWLLFTERVVFNLTETAHKTIDCETWPKYLNVEKRQKLTSGNSGPNNNMKETILTMYQALMNHLNN